MHASDKGKFSADDEKTVKELFDDSIATMLWLHLRFRALREGYGNALGEAEKLWTEIDILKDYLLLGETLDEKGQEKVEAMTGHIGTAFGDLCAALEAGKHARPPANA